METKELQLKVTEGLTVTILPNSNHEFLMSSEHVATGYGVSPSTIRSHQHLHPDELIKGKHFATAVEILDSEFRAVHNKVFWTKRGIIRLGFFIKSKQARIFRDWAEDLVLNQLEKQKKLLSEPHPVKALPARRKHNRLTAQRMVDIMTDVCRISDDELRLSITNKLMGGQA